MKTSYRYVAVSDDGRSWLLEGDECYDSTTDHNNVLPRLLGDGWEPVRERRLKDTVLVNADNGIEGILDCSSDGETLGELARRVDHLSR